jgi:hypothetical protein
MEKINYKELIKKYPWIVEKNQQYIISPDSDGFLSGLLATNYTNGTVVGFYDGKIALIKKGIEAKDCIFLDMDINRREIKSVGHHMVTYNRKINHENYCYQNCIQPNVMRNFDGKNNFQSKYPFGTIHFLLGIFQAAGLVKTLPKGAVWPLLFTDGVWNNLFGYTENCIEWINYLGIDDDKHILNFLFCSSHYSFYEIMLGLNDFLRVRDGFNAVGYYDSNNGEYIVGGRNKRTGDKLKISNSNGNPINLVSINGVFDIHSKEKIRIEGFINSMSQYIDWPYQVDKWHWNDFQLFKFSKGDFSNPPALSNQTYISLMDKKPLSMAMTSGTNIEYTLESPDKLI